MPLANVTFKRSSMNHRAQKKWGQNFLKDATIPQKIIQSLPLGDDSYIYIEIGPGKGALTEALLTLNNPVVAYEIDGRLESHLKTRFSGVDHFHLIMDDFLKRDIESDLKSLGFFKQPLHIVANLPYYITTPIIRKCLDLTHIASLTIMVQDEVAKRLAAEPSTKDYGALSVISQYYADIHYLFQVPPHAFSPAPKVHSAVIQMSMKKTRRLDPLVEPQFNQFIYQCFKQKRKTLVNNLQAEYPQAKAILLDYLNDQGLNPQSRAEALNLNHLLTLFQKITMDG